MSLADLNFAAAADAGRTLKLVHPETRVPLKAKSGEDVSLTLLGRDSDVYVQEELAGRTKAVDARLEGLKFSAPENEIEMIGLLAKLTTGWTGIPLCWVDPTAKDADGKPDETPVAFSTEAAKRLYSNRGVRWLRDAADKFIATRANFLPGALTS